jgi:integrase
MHTPRLCRVAGRKQWHIRVRGKRISTGETDRAKAERFLADFTGSQATKPAPGLTGILDTYLADRKEAGIPAAARLVYSAKPLKAFFGERPSTVVTAEEVKRYVKKRREAHLSDATIRTELQCLRAALRMAAKADTILKAPDVPMPPPPPPRDRWLTRDEATALLDAAGSFHIRLFILLGLHTAARPGALLDLTWDRADCERRRVDLNPAGRKRTKKGRAIVPMTDALLEGLLRAREVAVTEWVIEYAGKRVGSVKNGFANAAERAGLEGVTPNTLRHTAATWMAQSGVSLWDIAGFLGHSSIEMVQKVYAKHHPDFLRSASNALDPRQTAPGYPK